MSPRALTLNAEQVTALAACMIRHGATSICIDPSYLARSDRFRLHYGVGGRSAWLNIELDGNITGRASIQPQEN